MNVDLKKTYDVIIVGSGAAGGMAAKELTELGLDTLLLEAGPLIPLTGFAPRRRRWEFPLRGWLPHQDNAPRLESAWTERLLLSAKKYPYLTSPGTSFAWTRARAVGGRTLIWGLVSLRFGPDDFRARSIDGVGEDWPLGYEELAPFYERVERVMGICGTAEGLPNNPDSIFLPPVPMSCTDRAVQRGAARLGIRAIPGRAAVATVPHQGRHACQYIGNCERVCPIGAAFSSLTGLLPRAERTGKLALRPNAVVREVLLAEPDRVSGVSFIDRETRQEHRARARAVVLGASSLETTRLLLASTSRGWSAGLGNASGVLGTYCADHVMVVGRGFYARDRPVMPGARKRPRGCGLYIPKFRNLRGREQRKDFVRGYGIQIVDDDDFPSYATMIPGYGSAYQQELRALVDRVVIFSCFGEVIPREENQVALARNTVDELGMPVLELSVRYGENEQRMAADMIDMCNELAAAADVTLREVEGPLLPGTSVHEQGTCRMGLDPKRSMLNKYNQSHEIPNLFVIDGSAFPSTSEKNPTLTIMALASRAAHYLADQMKKRAF